MYEFIFRTHTAVSIRNRSAACLNGYDFLQVFPSEM